MLGKSKILFALLLCPCLSSNAWSVPCGAGGLFPFEQAVAKCKRAEGCYFEEFDRDCGSIWGLQQGKGVQDTCANHGYEVVDKEFRQTFAANFGAG